jgi:periplasmic protein TonB
MASSMSETILFSSLPKWRAPWYELVFGYGAQAVIVAILVWIPVFHPEVLEQPKKDYHAIELVPTPVPVNHMPQRQLPRPVVVAKLDPPPAVLHLAAPTPRPKPVENTPAPEVKIAERKPDLPPSTAPMIPKQLVRTNLFSTGSSAPQTIERPAAQVQTGGFGDPNGVAAKANPGKAVNIAQAGGFDMPTGPGVGNGTGGAKGAKGVVASAGFGSGTATADPHAGHGAVQTGGFGNSDVPAPTTVKDKPSTPAVAKLTAVEILSKPTPVYTQEARTKKIEGEVLLQVVFEATGRIRVLRVIRGLGYGLDDAAAQAAQQIRFKPAQQDGQPSDSTAVVHIIFQLA